MERFDHAVEHPLFVHVAHAARDRAVLAHGVAEVVADHRALAAFGEL